MTRRMSRVGIVTKSGDKGKTSLYCGALVRKDDIRVEICGSLDEVSSFLGMAKSLAKDERTKSVTDRVQKGLIILSSEIATTAAAKDRLKKKIDKNSICVLEKEIDCLENRCNIKIKTFCIQGENPVSSALDIARSITRRAERRCVTMTEENMLKNRNIIVYLNRLSDLLYLLARFNEKKR
jgi:cob(I)alamin adenosyltransferase